MKLTKRTAELYAQIAKKTHLLVNKRNKHYVETNLLRFALLNAVARAKHDDSVCILEN